MIVKIKYCFFIMEHKQNFYDKHASPLLKMLYIINNITKPLLKIKFSGYFIFNNLQAIIYTQIEKN